MSREGFLHLSEYARLQLKNGKTCRIFKILNLRTEKLVPTPFWPDNDLCERVLLDDEKLASPSKTFFIQKDILEHYKYPLEYHSEIANIFTKSYSRFFVGRHFGVSRHGISRDYLPVEILNDDALTDLSKLSGAYAHIKIFNCKNLSEVFHPEDEISSCDYINCPAIVKIPKWSKTCPRVLRFVDCPNLREIEDPASLIGRIGPIIVLVNCPNLDEKILGELIKHGARIEVY